MSRFVPGGSLDEPIQRDDEWLKAQQELEENRKRREAASRENGGKSLYEALEANKAAKQEAFEESVRLKNQFRSLDDDEVEFLDSVLESTRAQEAAVRKETAERLAAFRKQQEEAERASLALEMNTGLVEETPVAEWTVSGKKRKKGPEKEILKGVKLRKASTSTDVPKKAEPAPKPPVSTSKDEVVASPSAPAVAKATPTTLPSFVGLGLGGYSSSEDD
ncbi:hypothetical protein EJ06DRAFT_537413 [Trichodelitschia bisporula]|uniref:FAM192A/Fyv6 N-terminal domain-containing protein n=1 Tax=Trichodelitschia bisporula TaxID=703511 RepID=A0A6G1HZU3_9PEZI|nr:hypothetical protein EJ06DRAFT_537413 [Trichodelitschia bisporula]